MSARVVATIVVLAAAGVALFGVLGCGRASKGVPAEPPGTTESTVPPRASTTLPARAEAAGEGSDDASPKVLPPAADQPSTKPVLRTVGWYSWSKPKVSSVAWPEDKILVAGYADGLIAIGDPAADRPTYRHTEHTGPVTSVAVSPNRPRAEMTVASADDRGKIRLWRPFSGRVPPSPFELTQVIAAHTGSARCVAWSPDGTILASAGEDRAVRLWDPATAEETGRFRGHTAAVAALAWSPDGKRLASASSDNTVWLWEPATGRDTKLLEGDLVRVCALAWRRPDGGLLALGMSGSGRVALWGPATREIVRRLDGHTAAVAALAWSPDGKRLASGSWDATVRVWNPDTGRETCQFRTPDTAVVSIAWSPDGKQLAAAGAGIQVCEVPAEK